METFEYGDRVVHQLHGAGRALNSFPKANLVQVQFDGHRTTTDVHPVSLTKVVTHKFEARIQWKGGAITLSGALDKIELRRYMSRLDEEQMDSYTVTRIKSKEERLADYFKGMEAEDDALEGK